jgi:hypothetical protein
MWVAFKWVNLRLIIGLGVFWLFRGFGVFLGCFMVWGV